VQGQILQGHIVWGRIVQGQIVPVPFFFSNRANSGTCVMNVFTLQICVYSEAEPHTRTCCCDADVRTATAPGPLLLDQYQPTGLRMVTVPPFTPPPPTKQKPQAPTTDS
jgi:hypothetical protein